MPSRPFRSIRAVSFARRLARSRRASSGVEYGFLLALIVLAIFTALSEMAGVTVRMWIKMAARVLEATQAR